MQQNERMQPEMKTMTTNGEMEPTTVCTARAMALRDQGQYKLGQELVLVREEAPASEIWAWAALGAEHILPRRRPCC